MTFIYAKEEVTEMRKTEKIEEMLSPTSHFSHSLFTRLTNCTTLITEMFHRRLIFTALWLNHAFATHHYYPHEGHGDQENDHPYYEFKYGVSDHNTGDVKNQWEIRKGDKVKGEYSLLEPDGTVRTVQYSADKHHGFNAVVTRTGKSKHPTEKHHRTHAHANNLIKYLPEQLEEEPGFYPNHFRERESNFYSFEEIPYEAAESKRKSFYALPDVPPNHSPTYTGVTDYSKIEKMYKTFREQNSNVKKHKFDYGINEYFENGYEALNQRSKNSITSISKINFKRDLEK